MRTRKQIAELLNKPIQDLKIGFTASTFDLGPHIGHCLMLQEAKENCDYLIAALMTNPQYDRPEKNKPLQTTFERLMQVESNKYIDEVIVIDTEADLINAILIIQPNIRFVGEEYKGTQHTGWDLCPIYYNKRNHNFSSDDLQKRIKGELK